MTEEQRYREWEIERLARFQRFVLHSKEIAIAVTDVIEKIESRLWPRIIHAKN